MNSEHTTPKAQSEPSLYTEIERDAVRIMIQNQTENPEETEDKNLVHHPQC